MKIKGLTKAVFLNHNHGQVLSWKKGALRYACKVDSQEFGIRQESLHLDIGSYVTKEGLHGICIVALHARGEDGSQSVTDKSEEEIESAFKKMEARVAVEVQREIANSSEERTRAWKETVDKTKESMENHSVAIFGEYLGRRDTQVGELCDVEIIKQVLS